MGSVWKGLDRQNAFAVMKKILFQFSIPLPARFRDGMDFSLLLE